MWELTWHTNCSFNCSKVSLHSRLINSCIYTFSPPDGGTLGPPAGCTLGTTYGDAHDLIASGTLAFGRARVKGNTKLYNNVCINMP